MSYATEVRIVEGWEAVQHRLDQIHIGVASRSLMVIDYGTVAKPDYVLCLHQVDANGDYDMVPLARLLMSNAPYKRKLS